MEETKKLAKQSEKGAKEVYKEVKRDLSPVVKKVAKEAREIFEIAEKEVKSAKRKKQLQQSIDDDSITSAERKELEKKIKAVERQVEKLAKAIREEGKALAE